MKRTLIHSARVLLAAATLCCATARAADTLPPVKVEGESASPRAEKPLSDLLATLDVFEREHARFAPGAELRFRLLPRKQPEDAATLRAELRHGTQREPIELDALGRFAVPPRWRTLPEGAVVRASLPEARVAWAVDVRTPGLPAHARRLGDLRLECRADLYGGGLMRGLKPPAFYVLRAAADLCSSSQITFSFYADAPVFTARLTARRPEGDLTRELPYKLMHGSEAGESNPLFGLLDWPYALRDRTVLWNPGRWADWPHDALVVLEPMEAPSP